MQVREIMTENPACCTPDSTLRDIALMMKENDCGCIPVVDSQTGKKPVGTITDRDITIRVIADNLNPLNMKAADIMTTEIATVSPQSSIEECFRVMEDREIRRVLVVDEQGKCCGIVAQADVVQSGANPVRTNKVVREISESAPSQSQRSSGGKENSRFASNMPSIASGSSVLPLLIGLGSGAAVMYWLNTKQKSATQRNYAENLVSGNSESSYSDATNQESFGKYVDAEQQIDNKSDNKQDRNKVQAFRAKSNSPSIEMLELSDSQPISDDTVTTKEKRRSAGQS